MKINYYALKTKPSHSNPNAAKLMTLHDFSGYTSVVSIKHSIIPNCYQYKVPKDRGAVGDSE